MSELCSYVMDVVADTKERWKHREILEAWCFYDDEKDEDYYADAVRIGGFEYDEVCNDYFKN